MMRPAGPQTLCRSRSSALGASSASRLFSRVGVRGSSTTSPNLGGPSLVDCTVVVWWLYGGCMVILKVMVKTVLRKEEEE